MNIKELIKKRMAENRKLKAIRLKIRHEERIKTARYSELIKGKRQRTYIKKGKFWGTLATDLKPRNKPKTMRELDRMIFGGK